MLQILFEIFSDHTLRTVALGSAMIGISAGMLGSFAFLRRQSLVGDVVAHSSLAGITLAFLVYYAISRSGVKSQIVLLAGAALSGILAMMLVSHILNNTKVKSDAALGLMLALFFGAGIFFLKMIQQNAIPGNTGLETYIFGMAAAMTQEDIVLISILGLAVVIVTLLFWKEFKILSFDATFTESIGFNTKKLDTILSGAIVLAIIIGLQAVGVILMVTLIVAPASAARQWTNNLGVMVLLSSLIGAISGAGGAVVSALIPNLPTGPTIVLFATTIVLISILFAPRRGIFAVWAKGFFKKHNVFLDSVLLDLYLLESNHEGKDYIGHKSAVLRTMSSGKAGIRKTLVILEKLGMVELKDFKNDLWKLTVSGTGRAKQIISKRLQSAG